MGVLPWKFVGDIDLRGAVLLWTGREKRTIAHTKKASLSGGGKDASEGILFRILSQKITGHLARALTLRARRDFLRAAQFLWYTWFAAA